MSAHLERKDEGEEEKEVVKEEEEEEKEEEEEEKEKGEEVDKEEEEEEKEVREEILLLTKHKFKVIEVFNCSLELLNVFWSQFTSAQLLVGSGNVELNIVQ